MGGAPHQHHLAHAEGKLPGTGLRHVAERHRTPTQFPTAKAVAIDEHAAGAWRQQAEDRLEQRRSAATVGAEQAQNLTSLDGEANSGTDGPLAVAERQLLDGKTRGHDQTRRPKASGQRNTGVPITATITPSGSSTCPRPRVSDPPSADRPRSAAPPSTAAVAARRLSPDQQPGEVRHQQPDLADDATNRHRGGGHQRRSSDHHGAHAQ